MPATAEESDGAGASLAGVALACARLHRAGLAGVLCDAAARAGVPTAATACGAIRSGAAALLPRQQAHEESSSSHPAQWMVRRLEREPG